MAISASVVSVSTTATKLTASATTSSGSSVVVTPTAAVFIGAAGVTAAAGFPVAAGATVALDLRSDENLYAITASGTASVNVLQTGI